MKSFLDELMHRTFGFVFPISLFAIFFGCATNDRPDVNAVAYDYVKLGLVIGQYDADFVDAYYGPDSLRPNGTPSSQFPKDSLLQACASLKTRLQEILRRKPNDTTTLRAEWMTSQLAAFERRIKNFSGEYVSFDDESLELFGVKAPAYPEEHYAALIEQLDRILPGKGSVTDRYQFLSDRFIIPPNKVDTVFKLALREARRITSQRIKLPANESFIIEYVKQKPWSGYNWYKGNYQSLIQINIERPIYIDRAIDLACHEGYPGHHVYNVLLEKNLFRDKGWLEISLYPLFSPQSFIAEGSANYGIDMAFPEDEFDKYTKEILLPLAGLDTTGAQAFFKARLIRKKLNYARNEITRGIVNKTMSEEEITRWKLDYQFVKKEFLAGSSDFMAKYRSYVICYNYGEDTAREYVEQGSDNEEERWKKFTSLLSNPTVPADLFEKK